MSNKIFLDDEHGMAPVMEQCYWCGKENGAIALMGIKWRNAFPGEKEPPRKAVFHHNPCDDCKESFSQGVLLVEAKDTGRWGDVDERALEPKYFHGQDGILAQATGRFWVVAEAFAKMNFNGVEVEKGMMVLVDVAVGDMIQELMERLENERKDGEGYDEKGGE